MLRLGGIARERVEDVLGRRVAVLSDGTRAAPGTLPSHYAPRARVLVLDARDLAPRAAAETTKGRRVGVLSSKLPDGMPEDTVVVGSPADADEYARSLYTMLRAADTEHLDVLLAVPPPEVGIGAAVADRLRRAAGRSDS